MKIESIEIKNYRALKQVKIMNLSNMAVFIGKNGSGKTTLFDVFGFMHDCLIGNARSALAKRGGFKEVVSRECEGKDIHFVIKFRPSDDDPLLTYELSIGALKNGDIAVKKETLRMRRGQGGAPWKILDFSNGVGYAADGDLRTYDDVKPAIRKRQKLDSPDILAIKGLGQFREFEAIAKFRRLIEDWYVADFRIDYARERREADYGEQLTTTGENLSVVAKYLFENHPDIFDNLIEKMKRRVPGVESVAIQITQDGYIVLQFQDGKFKNPFSAKFVSDGTIKMFTYLVLLHDPKKHALLCVEEPENQLYPELLGELEEEFDSYANDGGQVFVSTHSPDFLNATELEKIYCLIKKDGYTTIVKASSLPRVKSLYDAGDLPGELWMQGILTGEDA